MSKSRLFAVVGVLLVLSGIVIAVAFSQPGLTPLPETVTGVVLNENGPVAGAIVQVQATENRTQTADDGTFTLTGLGGTTPVVVTAWSDGHYNGWTTLDPAAPNWQDGGISISLRPLPEKDHSDYGWYESEGVEGSAACGLCHREYEEWQKDQHGRAAINHKFLNMYTGTNRNGDEGQPVAWSREGAALPPDPDKPYYGPGFLPDNPGGRAGNCAACHTPMASKASNEQNCAWSGCHTSLTIERADGLIDWPAMPVHLSGDAAEGISCEFCHKIGDVILDPETNMPYPDMPGILSLRLYRPETADSPDQVFFGNLVDVNRPDSYLPLISESEYCAACHFGVFGGVMGDGTVTGGTVIYNSYGEWLDSPYSDPETGTSCQECHMPVSDANWFVVAERDGLERDYATLHDHTMLGAADEDFLQTTVTMESTAQRTGDQLEVNVSITNARAGHHVPTGVPLRSMILVVEVTDAGGNRLTLARGPVNPDYSGDYGGLPGKTFAKVLRDDWTGETPTGAFWRPVTIVEDTRLAALATDTSRYTFDVPAGQAVTVDVRLIFRRAFYKLMQQKGWDDPDILMEHETIQITAN